MLRSAFDIDPNLAEYLTSKQLKLGAKLLGPCDLWLITLMERLNAKQQCSSKIAAILVTKALLAMSLLGHERQKQRRRVATRYDKLAADYLAFVQLASIRLWRRINESTS